jgi:membrane-anchored protein YejM (alkaline phosphatase superfamily)
MEVPGMAFPGLMRSLAREGYATKVYYTPFQNDETMFRSLGAEAQYLQQRTAPGASSEQDPAALKLAADRATIAAVRQDLATWSREQRNFCIAIGPQIGHAPWPTLPGSGPELLSRGRAAIREQDRWLGQLAEQLRQQGRLERTLIVVVGDHGVRTRQEDPAFEGGMIDDYSFHVPLLLFAPGVLGTRREVPWLTSHIDIAPTLLDLLGIETGRSLEQGAPLWDERLADRVTFFFANHYLGADGYTDQGRYFMKNHVSATVYAAGAMRFGTDDAVAIGSAGHAAVADRIRNMVALQEVLGRKAGEGGRATRGD